MRPETAPTPSAGTDAPNGSQLSNGNSVAPTHRPRSSTTAGSRWFDHIDQRKVIRGHLPNDIPISFRNTFGTEDPSVIMRDDGGSMVIVAPYLPSAPPTVPGGLRLDRITDPDQREGTGRFQASHYPGEEEVRFTIEDRDGDLEMPEWALETWLNPSIIWEPVRLVEVSPEDPSVARSDAPSGTT